MFALNASTGAIVWGVSPNAAIISSPAVTGASGNQALFVGDFAGGIDAFSVGTGAKLLSIATGGFINTRIEGVVVFTRAKLGDVSSSGVPVVEGLDAAVSYLTRYDPRMETSAERTRALADALVGPIRLAIAS